MKADALCDRNVMKAIGLFSSFLRRLESCDIMEHIDLTGRDKT